MNRLLAAGLALICAGALGIQAACASDWNLLGFYAGAGIGESTVRSDEGFDPDYPLDSHAHHTAYKVLAGIRPIPFVGAEAEYIDFGHPSSTDGYFDGLNGSDYSADSHPKAGVLSAVGYLPLPFLDVFAKVGVARLETNLNSYADGLCTQIDPGGTCGPPVLTRQHAWQTKAAYGGGVQVHFFGSLAVRGEYERINSVYGDPDAFMLSANWTF
jgi:opacity protein-like surface antigen